NVLTVNVGSFDRHERDSDRNDGNRDGCGDPSADERHGTAEHEGDGNGQQSEVPWWHLSKLHHSHLPFLTHRHEAAVGTHRGKRVSRCRSETAETHPDRARVNLAQRGTSHPCPSRTRSSTARRKRLSSPTNLDIGDAVAIGDEVWLVLRTAGRRAGVRHPARFECRGALVLRSHAEEVILYAKELH